MKLKVNKKSQVIIPDSFERIKQEELQTGDILLFIGGNKLTEMHGRHRKKKYGRSTNPPYHAAIVYKNDGANEVLILDQEIRGTLSFLQEYTSKKELRIDVVRPPAPVGMLDNIQGLIKALAVKEKYYDWKGFFSFANQMPYVGWMFGWMKPSKSTFYCSDVVAYVWENEGIRVSPRGHNFTAPLDLQLYGMEHHQCFTLKLSGELNENT